MLQYSFKKTRIHTQYVRHVILRQIKNLLAFKLKDHKGTNMLSVLNATFGVKMTSLLIRAEASPSANATIQEDVSKENIIILPLILYIRMRSLLSLLGLGFYLK